jgi:hypothetical protein
LAAAQLTGRSSLARHNRRNAAPGFLEIRHIAKKPQPAERAQCLGEMPWSCRATAIKPDIANLIVSFRKSIQQSPEPGPRRSIGSGWTIGCSAAAWNRLSLPAGTSGSATQTFSKPNQQSIRLLPALGVEGEGRTPHRRLLSAKSRHRQLFDHLVRASKNWQRHVDAKSFSGF